MNPGKKIVGMKAIHALKEKVSLKTKESSGKTTSREKIARQNWR
jgi:hypothetical protein